MKDIKEYEQSIKKGVWRHFKGNLYEVLAIARHSEDTRPMVVYRALYGEGDIWVRDAEMWEEYVERDGAKHKRFEFVCDAEQKNNYI